MALRLTAPSEDILGANYKITKIVASDYNPNIDSTITVTVTVKDVYDDPVENESVQVTCNIGKFTKLNGSTISDTQSVTGNTDSNGQFALTYTCSEWGLATFSANNVKIQINVGGYRTTNPHQYYTVYEYQHRAGVRIHIPVDISFTNAMRNINDSVIPHRLAPRYPVMIVCANGNTATANTAIGVRESVDLEHTEIIVKSLSGADVSRNAYAYVEWDKKY